MKKHLFYGLLFFTIGISAQISTHGAQVKMETVPLGSVSDSLLTIDASGYINHLAITSLPGGTESDPLWLAEENNVPRIDASNTYPQQQIFDGSIRARAGLSVHTQQSIRFLQNGNTQWGVQMEAYDNTGTFSYQDMRIWSTWSQADLIVQIPTEFEISIADINARGDSTAVHKGWVQDYVENSTDSIGGVPIINLQTKDITTTFVSSNYTVDSLDVGNTIILEPGVTTITLDDSKFRINDQVTFINKSNVAVSWAYGTGDFAMEGVLSDIPDKSKAHAHLIDVNEWSVTVGGSGGSGIANVVEDTTPQLGGNLDTNGKDIEMFSQTVGIGYGDFGSPSIGNSFLYFNNNAPTFRSYDSSSAVNYGSVSFDYDDTVGYDMIFTDNANSNATGTIRYFGLGDGFIVTDITNWNFQDGIVQGRWQYVTGENSTTSSITIASTDSGEIIYFTGSTDITVTFNEITSGLFVGQQVSLVQAGTGKVTVATSNYGTVIKKVTTPQTQVSGDIIQVVYYQTDKIHIFGNVE